MIATEVTLELSWYALWLVPLVGMFLLLCGSIVGWVELGRQDAEDFEEGEPKGPAYAGLLWVTITHAFGLYAVGYMFAHSLP